MHKILVFDFDGTLVNSDEAIYLSRKEMFENFYNGDFSNIPLHEFSGPPISVTHEKYFSSYSYDFIKNQYLERTTKYYFDHIFLFENEIEVLKRLKEKGYKLTIFTNKSKDKVNLCLQMFSMENLFDFIVTGNDISLPKPNPEGLVKIINHFRCSKNELFFVGDTIYDYETAKNCAVDFAFLTILNRENIEDKDAIYLNNFKDLENHF